MASNTGEAIARNIRWQLKRYKKRKKPQLQLSCNARIHFVAYLNTVTLGGIPTRNWQSDQRPDSRRCLPLSESLDLDVCQSTGAVNRAWADRENEDEGGEELEGGEDEEEDDPELIRACCRIEGGAAGAVSRMERELKKLVYVPIR